MASMWSSKNDITWISMMEKLICIMLCQFNKHFLAPIVLAFKMYYVNANWGRFVSFACQLSPFFTQICAGAHHLKITMYKYFSSLDGCQGWVGTDSGLVSCVYKLDADADVSCYWSIVSSVSSLGKTRSLSWRWRILPLLSWECDHT